MHNLLMSISTLPPGKKSDHVEKSNTVIQKTDTTVCLPNGTLFNSDCEYTRGVVAAPSREVL